MLGMRRALTLPLPEKGSRETTWDFTQNTVDQSNSVLCTRLPYEVRSLIFELVVAGESNVAPHLQEIEEDGPLAMQETT